MMPPRTSLIPRSRAQHGVSKDAFSGCIAWRRRLRFWLLLALASFAGDPHASAAEISDGVVRIGLILDLSGPYSANTGKGSAAAGQMAGRAFGQKRVRAPSPPLV